MTSPPCRPGDEAESRTNQISISSGTGRTTSSIRMQVSVSNKSVCHMENMLSRRQVVSLTHLRELVSPANSRKLHVSTVCGTELSVVILAGTVRKGCAAGESVPSLSLHHKLIYHDSRERTGKVADSVLLCSGTVQVETEGRLGVRVCKLEERTHPASHGLEQEAPFRDVEHR